MTKSFLRITTSTQDKVVAIQEHMLPSEKVPGVQPISEKKPKEKFVFVERSRFAHPKEKSLSCVLDKQT
jgi:hypothetical protein